MSSEEQIEKLIHTMREHAKPYAEAKADRKHLEHYRKIVKARLMSEVDGPGHQKEAYAYAHNDYVEVIDGIREAVLKEEELHWRLKAAEAQIDVWRTQQANNRTERASYGA